MALGYYTTDSLIDQIKRKAMLPTNQSTFTDTDFLAFANEELKVGIVPSVLSLHEEFYVFSQSVPLISNKSSYQIPYRAIGGRLRDIFYSDANGNLIEMSRISPDDKSLYQQSTVGTNYIFFYVEGNNIVITPPVSSSPTGSLVLSYYIRPSDLVSESRIAEITNIATDSDAGTTTFTVDGIPTGFSVLTRLDLLQAKPGHKIRNIDLLATSISSNNKTITFLTSEIDSDVEVGDMVALAGECMIPQCPSDLHPILAQRCAARCLEALGDTQGLTNANTKLQEMEVKTIALIDNRVDGAPKKVVNNRGLLGRSRISRRW
jgi:hypothetical protein